MVLCVTMVSKDSIEDMIVTCFEKIGEPLSYSELKFLLLKNQDIPPNITAKKRKKYKDWNKKYGVSNQYEYPFKRIKHETQLKRGLDKLKDKGILVQNNRNKKYLLRGGNLQSLLETHRDILNQYQHDNLKVLSISDNLTLYGLIPVNHVLIDRRFTESIKDKLDTLKEGFNEEINQIIVDLTIEITYMRINSILEHIKKSRYKKKDKRLGFQYIQEVILTNKVDQFYFDWIKKKSRGNTFYYLLKYKPEDYLLNKDISTDILNILNILKELEDRKENRKMLVFIPPTRLPDKDYIRLKGRLYSTVEEIQKEK